MAEFSFSGEIPVDIGDPIDIPKGLTVLCTRCKKNPISKDYGGYFVGKRTYYGDTDDGFPVYAREDFPFCDSCKQKLNAFMTMEENE